MNIYNKIYLLITVLLITSCTATKKVSQEQVNAPAQDAAIPVEVDVEPRKSALTVEDLRHWQHRDLVKDATPGMSVDRAYEYLKGKKGNDVIVAVIDTGIDINHEDLKDVIWTNEDEIPNNGIDDDKNGYIDDVHGWNFIGKMEKAKYESERILSNPKSVDPKTYTKLKTEFEAEKANAKEESKFLVEDMKNIERKMSSIKSADKLITNYLGKSEYTLKEVAAIQTTDKDLLKQVRYIKDTFGEGEESIQFIKNEMKNIIKIVSNQYIKNQEIINGTYLSKNYRKIIGDNPDDISDKYYGDANVGPINNDEMHGTHVAGIIAAKRHNGIGMNGIADHAKIMVVRTIPGDGDEYDKDVALAIRYAVDNGAKVINGSFGKGYSPHQKWVYDAIQYAAKNDVLIINASGNDSANIDKTTTYPNDTPTRFVEIANNFVVVGANTPSYDESIAASFSNYGKQNVDVFAPGESIYSTIPNGEYESMDGTSMAAPCVAGVAALIRSYYPKLSASQVKQILMKSGTKINLKVIKPVGFSGALDFGSEEQGSESIPFSDLSSSGSVINAYNALKMCYIISTNNK